MGLEQVGCGNGEPKRGLEIAGGSATTREVACATGCEALRRWTGRAEFMGLVERASLLRLS